MNEVKIISKEKIIVEKESFKKEDKTIPKIPVINILQAERKKVRDVLKTKIGRGDFLVFGSIIIAYGGDIRFVDSVNRSSKKLEFADRLYEAKRQLWENQIDLNNTVENITVEGKIFLVNVEDGTEIKSQFYD